jgi:hypothetical protein
MFVMLSALIGVIVLHDPYNPFQGRGHSSELFSLKEIFTKAKRPPKCVRRPLPSWAMRSDRSRKYHAFDDVLLIVFFSHARYDVNLDYYQEVYGDYFPNVNYFSLGVVIDLTRW